MTEPSRATESSSAQRVLWSTWLVFAGGLSPREPREPGQPTDAGVARQPDQPGERLSRRLGCRSLPSTPDLALGRVGRRRAAVLRLAHRRFVDRLVDALGIPLDDRLQRLAALEAEWLSETTGVPVIE